jgi:uncharacterized protein YjbI with pentapeptide repeats
MARGKGTSAPQQDKEARQSKPWTLKERWGKTYWDWMDLLLVPILILILTVVFTLYQDFRQNQREDKRIRQAQKIENQRAQDLTLQGYLDQMSTLVLEDQKSDKVQVLMRARTLTALSTLDPGRKSEVMRFLGEANLVHSQGDKQPVISLFSADLSDVDLPYADLRGAALFDANLSNANLSNAKLSDAELSVADLSDANLLGANLSNAYLWSANLGGVTLFDADLSDADLSGAYGLADEQIAAANTLAGATMPNGQKYEDWIKDKNGNHRE